MESRPLVLFCWLVITKKGELCMSDLPLTDQDIAQWKDCYRSFSLQQGACPCA